MLAQVGPRFQSRDEPFSDSCDVEEHRFATLMNGEPAQPDGVHAGRTEQLGGGTKMIEAVRVFTQAEGHADFLVGHSRGVRWERLVKITLVVLCAPLHSNLQ